MKEEAEKKVGFYEAVEENNKFLCSMYCGITRKKEQQKDQ